MRRGTVVEVVELGELTVATVIERPDDRLAVVSEGPAGAGEGNEREEVVVARA